ncbi:MAG: hypothetical protein V4649_13885 [Bacteroidota bacterium]
MKKVIFTLLACSLVIFNSCTRTGPIGPQGPQGAQGIQGNANVNGSDPFTVSSWQYSSAEIAYYASFNDADITNAVADRGVVEVYLKYADGTWRSLPDIVAGTQFYSRFSAGGFEIYYGNVNGTTPSPPTTQTFRVVVIEPSFKAAHPNTNWKNYNEVMKAMSQDQAGAAGVRIKDL